MLCLLSKFWGWEAEEVRSCNGFWYQGVVIVPLNFAIVAPYANMDQREWLITVFDGGARGVLVCLRYKLGLDKGKEQGWINNLACGWHLSSLASTVYYLMLYATVG